jgi:hypothetical protein
MTLKNIKKIIYLDKEIINALLHGRQALEQKLGRRLSETAAIRYAILLTFAGKDAVKDEDAWRGK